VPRPRSNNALPEVQAAFKKNSETRSEFDGVTTPLEH